MMDTTAGGPRSRPAGSELRLCLILLVVGFAVSFAAVKYYRSQGQQPSFYQQNFGPAVMMACGYGFTSAPAHSTPPSLTDFVLLRAQTFRCEDFPTDMVPERVTWNGTWYYLYGTVALIWRVTGISWTALDGLAATLGALELLALYGLFRLVASRRIAIACAAVMLIAPFNLHQLMFLRDFSKAPFVLGSLFIIGCLVMRTFSTVTTVMLAVAFGVVAGVGYGFRSDLIVMAPFGVAMILLFLPGPLRVTWRRNAAAAAAAAVAFLIAAAPPLMGQRTGGCQFHYALLGLTSPLTDQMNLESPMYAFGNHFLDTFVDLKVADYSHRVMDMAPPILCAPDYDRASGEIFVRMATTFPADLVMHAYGSVLAILRSSLAISIEGWVGYIPWAFVIARPIDRLLSLVGLAGPFIAMAAVAVAWVAAPRLGLALTAAILFLTGYPAVEFEARHWFHLRFLPLWTALVLWGAYIHRRGRWTMQDLWRGLAPTLATALLMVVALAGFRLLQRPPVDALIESYLAAPAEALATSTTPHGVAVEWAPEQYGIYPTLHGSDMLRVSVAPTGCGTSGPVDLTFRYDAPHPSHDLTSTMNVVRVPGGATEVFFPVFTQTQFDKTLLRFTRLEVRGAAPDCLARVARVTDRSLPLLVQVQVPPDWQDRPYYQALRLPRKLRFLE
jgi:hypothetical protein